MGAVDIFNTATLFIATLLCAVGTGVSQLKAWGFPGRIYLYNADYNGIRFDASDVCEAYGDRFRAAYAFAIITCVLVGIAFFVSFACLVVPAKIGKAGKLMAIGLTATGFVTSLVAWAIVVGTFQATPCDGQLDSIKDLGGVIDTGCQLLIITCCVLLVNLVTSVLGLFVVDDGSATYSFSFIALARFVLLTVASLFVTLGTGLPQLRGELPAAFSPAIGFAGEAKVYLYQLTVGKSSFKISSAECSSLTDRLRAAYAFAILSCIFIVVNWILVATQLGTAGSLRVVSIALTAAAFLATLISWGVTAAAYYDTDLCNIDISFHDAGFDLSSGIALIIVAWLITIADLIVGIVSLFLKPAAAAAAKSEPTANSESGDV